MFSDSLSRRGTWGGGVGLAPPPQTLSEAGGRCWATVTTPTTRAWADEIGADGYAEDAIEAVATAKTILAVG